MTAAYPNGARVNGLCRICGEAAYRWDAEKGDASCQNEFCGAYSRVGDMPPIRPAARPWLPRLEFENKGGHINAYAQPTRRNSRGRKLVYQIWPHGRGAFAIFAMPGHTQLAVRSGHEKAQEFASGEWREWLEKEWGAGE